MWPFGKPIEQLVEADLQQFVGALEHQFLEFKEAMYARKNPNARLEMLRDVSSIANGGGGVIIIGMAEDGNGRGTGLRNVPDARVEGDRLVSTVLGGIKDRIGVRTEPVAVTGGEVLVVHVPTSYRKPYMVVAEGANEFWIRHDRQKSRMAIDEVRALVLTTEDLEMKAEKFIRERHKDLGANGAFLVVSATPLSLPGGAVEVNGPLLKDILRNIDVGGTGALGIMLTGGEVGRPTLYGRAVGIRSDQSIEVFRTGHVEFLLRNKRTVMWPEEQAQAYFHWTKVLDGPAVAEYVFRVLQLARQVAERFTIADPQLLAASFWGIGGFSLSTGRVGGRGTPWTNYPELFLDSVVVGIEERPDDGLRRVLDPIWNAFGYEACPYFNKEGRYTPPQQ